jgi:hypothetical protein
MADASSTAATASPHDPRAVTQAPLREQADTIKMTVMDGYPPRVLWISQFEEFYIPEVDKRLAAGGKYKIEWTKAWSGQIVKPTGVLEGVENGLGDILWKLCNLLFFILSLRGKGIQTCQT